MQINERSPEIAAFLDEWKNNRTLIQGEHAVKACGERFLPRPSSMSRDDHKNMVSRTPFYPGAARTHEGLKALASRKPASLDAPDAVSDILNTITARGYTVDDLAGKILSEMLVTNFVGLVVDYPPSPGPISKADAISKGIRPFIAMYTAENILGIETGVINNRQRVTRVRLQDDKDTIRELLLRDGVYSVNVWKLVSNDWIVIETITPTGPEPIDEIPFTLVSSAEDFEPAKPPLSDVCALNKQLFLASSNLAQAQWWLSMPIPYKVKKAAEGDVPVSVAPGTIWEFDCDPKEVEVGFLEYSGSQVQELRNEVIALKDDMAKMGSRMLSPDKAVAEAADTEAIRRATENALLASLVHIRDRKLNDSLAWVAWWLGLEEGSIAYSANTDFNAIPLDAQALAFRKTLFDTGVISKDAFLDILISEEVLPDTFDREGDAQKIAEEIADRPPAIAMPITADPAGDQTDPTA
jgi:hypothetical protein